MPPPTPGGEDRPPGGIGQGREDGVEPACRWHNRAVIYMRTGRPSRARPRAGAIARSAASPNKEVLDGNPPGAHVSEPIDARPFAGADRGRLRGRRPIAAAG